MWSSFLCASARTVTSQPYMLALGRVASGRDSHLHLGGRSRGYRGGFFFWTRGSKDGSGRPKASDDSRYVSSQRRSAAKEAAVRTQQILATTFDSKLLGAVLV